MAPKNAWLAATVLFSLSGCVSPVETTDASAGASGGQKNSGAWRELREKRFKGHEGAVTNVQFNSVGSRLASVGYDKKVRLWQMPEGRALRTLPDMGQGAAFGPDLKYMAVARYPIQQFDLSSGNLRFYLGETHSLAYGPNGDILADGQSLPGGGENGMIRLWSVSDGQLIRTLEGHKRYVTGLAFSSDGKLLASGGGDGMIRLWSVADGALVHSWEQESGVGRIAFSPDGKLLASAGSQGGPVCIWRIPEATLLHKWQWDSVLDLAFRPNGQVLAVCSTSDAVGSPSLHLWRVSDGKQLQVLVDDVPEARCITFSPKGDVLVAGMADGTIRFFSPPEKSPTESEGQANGDAQSGGWQEVPQHRLQPHGKPVTSLAFSADGLGLASGSEDNTIWVMRLPGGALRTRVDFLAHFFGHAAPVTFIGFKPDRKTVISSGEDKGVRVWRVEGAPPPEPRILDIEGPLALSPDGDYLANAQPDGKINLLHASDAKLWRTLEGHIGAVECLKYDPKGKLLASSGADGTVRLWSVTESKLLYTFREHPDRAGSLAFSPDGKLLAGGGREKGTICIWRVSDGALLQKWEWNPVLDLDFSSDGEMLAVSSTSDDEVFPALLHLVRVSDGTPIQTLRDELPAARCVVFSPITDLLAAGMTDGSVRFFTPSGDK